MVDMLNGIFGWNWTTDDLDRANRDLLRTEIEFNQRAGITAVDHRIPEYMRREPLAPHNVTFDIPDSELDSIFETL
jgi:aldehyde:ferredoxin oxidoreductase